MRGMTLAVTAVAVTSLGACGGSTTSPNPGQSPSCSITITGGGSAAGTYDCKPATTVWATANNEGGFSFTVASPAISVAIGWTGEPTTGVHYKNSDAGAQGGVSVTTGSGASTQAWGATVSPANGTYDLSFSGVSNTISTANGKAYATDGSLTATLVPLTGQAGNITVSVTF
jgi:hypothetical protein